MGRLIPAILSFRFPWTPIKSTCLTTMKSLKTPWTSGPSPAGWIISITRTPTSASTTLSKCSPIATRTTGTRRMCSRWRRTWKKSSWPGWHRCRPWKWTCRCAPKRERGNEARDGRRAAVIKSSCWPLPGCLPLQRLRVLPIHLNRRNFKGTDHR